MSDLEQQKDQQLSQQYQQFSDEQPPAELDQMILEAAHRDVDNDSQPGVDTSPVRRSWYVPVSYVAILVVSLSVVMKIALEPGISHFELGEPQLSEPGSEINESRTMSRKAEPGISALKKSESQPDEIEQQRMFSPPAPGESVTGAVRDEFRSREPASVAPAAMPAPSAYDAQPGLVEEKAARQITVKSEAGEDSPVKAYQQEVERMLKLLENEQFEELKQALEACRKNYADEIEAIPLPQTLLDWEVGQKDGTE